MTRPVIYLTVFVVALVCGGPSAVGQVLISDFINEIVANPGKANGDPLPDNLFDTSGLNPFSNMTVTGNSTLATVWEQTITIQRPGAPVNVGTIANMPPQIQVTETQSQFQFYEFPTEQTFVTAGDPIIHSSFEMAGGGGGGMTLNLVDPDVAPGVQPFINDLFPKVPVNNGTEIAVWEGAPIAVEIVALTLTGVEPIAVNTMIPYQFFADDTVNPVLDNAFGVFTGDWSLPLGPNVLLRENGLPGDALVPSDFLEEWVDMPQFRWKGHPSGWVMVITGSPLPGPAGIIHGGGGGGGGGIIPEPSTFVLAILGLFSLGMIGRRRRRR